MVGYEENDDGTIALTVHVVFPYEGLSKVYAHEVVVRPMEEGGVQYVSNRIIPSENNYEETWHTPRLTEEEWKKIYEGEETKESLLAVNVEIRHNDLFKFLSWNMINCPYSQILIHGIGDLFPLYVSVKRN